MANGTELGVKDYDQFDPALGRKYSPNSEFMDEAKLAYLRTNILPLLRPLAHHASILEIGPGRGSLLHLLKQVGFRNVTGFEVCEAYAKRLCEQGFSVTQGNQAVGFLEERLNSFDAIVLVDVLEHLEREEGYALVRACEAALKPCGKLILQLPNMSGLFGANTCVADFTHRHSYNEHSLKSLLHAAGFDAARMLPLQLPAGPANVVRSVLRECVFACVRLLTRIVGATPVRVLTHNIVALAEKSSATEQSADWDVLPNRR